MSQSIQDFFGPSAYADTRLGSHDPDGGWVHFYWPELAAQINGQPEVYTDTQIVATLLAYLHKKLNELNTISDPASLIASEGEIEATQVIRGEVEQLSYALTFLIFRADPTGFDPDLIA